MKDRIREKMVSHVKYILDKPTITNEEYMLIGNYLAKLEFEETQVENARKAKESVESNQNKLKALMETMFEASL